MVTHTTFEMVPRTPATRTSQLYRLKSEVSISFVVSYAQPVTQQYESRAVRKASLQPMHTEWVGAARPSYINYRLKSEVFITLHCWLCSIHYTAVRIKNCFKNTSAIEVATMKHADDFHYEGKPSRVTTKLTLFAVSKDQWDTKEDTGKSMKNALYVLQHAKRHLSG